MRLDRFITLNIARPLRTVLTGFSPSPRWGEGRGEVLPVLMYHSISDQDERHLSDYFKVCTAPERFRLQMRALRDHGYTGVDLETGLAWLSASSKMDTCLGSDQAGRTCSSDKPFRPVVITFDDGFRDFFTEAVPVMKEHGFTATMYLPTAFIGEERRSFKGIPCMTWDEVREAQGAEMRFGSHTVNHPVLYKLSWPEIESELRDSRRELEDRLGETISSFAYPYAFPEADKTYCGRLGELLLAVGYSNCVTTIIGRVSEGDDPSALRRLPMNGADDVTLLLAKLKGAYDWMAPLQRSFKGIKRVVRPSAVRPANRTLK